MGDLLGSDFQWGGKDQIYFVLAGTVAPTARGVFQGDGGIPRHATVAQGASDQGHPAAICIVAGA